MPSKCFRGIAIPLLVLVLFSVPMTVAAGPYPVNSSRNKLSIDPNMKNRHRISRKSDARLQEEKEAREREAKLVREYENFQFTAKYNDLAAAFNKLKDDIDIEETKRLLDEFKAANLRCYRLIYTMDVSPESKGDALKELNRRYQELKAYRSRKGRAYLNSLEGRSSELQEDLDDREEQIDSLESRLDRLTEEKKTLEVKLQQSLRESSLRRDEAADEIHALRIDLRKASGEKDALEGKLETAKSEIARLNKSVEDLRASLRKRNGLFFTSIALFVATAICFVYQTVKRRRPRR